MFTMSKIQFDAFLRPARNLRIKPASQAHRPTTLCVVFVFSALFSVDSEAWDGPNYRCGDTNLESADCAPSDDWINMFDGRSLDGWTLRASDDEKKPSAFSVQYPESVWSKIEINDWGNTRLYGFQNLEFDNLFDSHCGEFEMMLKFRGSGPLEPGGQNNGGTGLGFASYWNKNIGWYSGPKVEIEASVDRTEKLGGNILSPYFQYAFSLLGSDPNYVDLKEWGYYKTGFIYNEYTTTPDPAKVTLTKIGNNSGYAYPESTFPDPYRFKMTKEIVNKRPLFAPLEYRVTNTPQPDFNGNIGANHPMAANPTGPWHTMYVKWADGGKGVNNITTIVDGQKIVDQWPLWSLANQGEVEQHGGRFGHISLQRHALIPIWTTKHHIEYKGLYFRAPSVSNLAKGMPTLQSSNYSAAMGFAGNAVDDKVDGNSTDGSVTQTKLETNPWWKVSLRGNNNLLGVTVWNPINSPEWLSSYTVVYYNSAGAEIAKKDFRWPAHKPRTVYVPFAAEDVGQVRIVASGTNRILSLAEVQVWGKNKAEQNVCAAPGNAPWKK